MTRRRARIVDRGAVPAELRSPLLVGFLGAYTTFSTLMLDSWRPFEDGLPMLALAPVLGCALALTHPSATNAVGPSDGRTTGPRIVVCPYGDSGPSGDPKPT